MDSVTQFVLGAGVGAAVLGRRIGVRKAAVTGGLLATLPDLDVFWPNGDPVDRFVTHRGVTHSLLVHALVTPILGEGLRRVFKPLGEDRLRVYLAVFLILTTHALLDSLTIYGTQLFWPLWPEPLGLGSIFIIDPLYSLPLLAMAVWAFFQGSWTPSYGRWLKIALVFSTAYLGWTAVAQQAVAARGKQVLADQGLGFEHLIASPTPFNSLFWRVIAVDGPRYYDVFVPLLGGREATTLYAHQRFPEGTACSGENSLAAIGAARKLAKFSDEFYELRIRNGILEYADLRMGLPGGYVFTFAVAEVGDDGSLREIPPRHLNTERVADGDFDWLQAGLLGQKMLRPLQLAQAVDMSNSQVATAAQKSDSKC